MDACQRLRRKQVTKEMETAQQRKNTKPSSVFAAHRPVVALLGRVQGTAGEAVPTAQHSCSSHSHVM
jgi:hypothetical protein